MCRSPNIVRVIKSRTLRWAGQVDTMEEGRSTSKILTGKPTGKRPLGRSRYQYEKLGLLVSGNVLLVILCECDI